MSVSPLGSGVVARLPSFEPAKSAFRSVLAAKNPGMPGRVGLPQGRPNAAGHLSGEQVVGQLHAAQAKLDQLLELAQSGRTFTPAELLALQARVYESSQTIDLAGRMVEKVTSGVKQVLQTTV